MHRPGCDPDRLEMSDVLCDFCGAEWSDDRPMVEGHRGACICGPCLTAAYSWSTAPATTASSSAGGPADPTDPAADAMCSLCREPRAEPMWSGAHAGQARACRRCIRQSAAVLQKDADSGWKRPDASAAPLR